MTRMSKQGERRAVSRRRPRAPQPKTGPVEDNLPGGFKPHVNAIQGDVGTTAFIPKIRNVKNV